MPSDYNAFYDKRSPLFEHQHKVKVYGGSTWLSKVAAQFGVITCNHTWNYGYESGGPRIDEQGTYLGRSDYMIFAFKTLEDLVQFKLTIL